MPHYDIGGMARKLYLPAVAEHRLVRLLRWSGVYELVVPVLVLV